MFSQSSVARRGRSLHLNAQQLALPGLVSTTFSACIVVELRVGVIYCKVTKRRRVAMSSLMSCRRWRSGSAHRTITDNRNISIFIRSLSGAVGRTTISLKIDRLNRTCHQARTQIIDSVYLLSGKTSRAMSRTTSGHPTRALVRRASSTDGGLPSSTVISIGGGFVAFAVTVLTLLTIARVIRLAREARRERSSGQGTTFRQLWNREGGFWGFITGLGGESAAGGAGFVDLGRHRRWEEMLLRERWMLARMNEEEGDVGEIPRMSEVGVREKGAMLEESDFQVSFIAVTWSDSFSRWP